MAGLDKRLEFAPAFDMGIIDKNLRYEVYLAATLFVILRVRSKSTSSLAAGSQ